MLGTLILLTAGVFVAQIAYGIHHIHKPIKCDDSELLTILILAGGFSGILSIIFVACCCHSSSFTLRSSNS